MRQATRIAPTSPWSARTGIATTSSTPGGVPWPRGASSARTTGPPRLLNWLVGRCSDQHCLWSTHKRKETNHADTTTDTREARRPECPPAAAALPRAASPGSPPSRGPTGDHRRAFSTEPSVHLSAVRATALAHAFVAEPTLPADARALLPSLSGRSVRSRGAEHRVVRHPPPKHAFDGRGVAGSPSAPARRADPTVPPPRKQHAWTEATATCRARGGRLPVRVSALERSPAVRRRDHEVALRHPLGDQPSPSGVRAVLGADSYWGSSSGVAMAARHAAAADFLSVSASAGSRYRSATSASAAAPYRRTYSASPPG